MPSVELVSAPSDSQPNWTVPSARPVITPEARDAGDLDLMRVGQVGVGERDRAARGIRRRRTVGAGDFRDRRRLRAAGDVDRVVAAGDGDRDRLGRPRRHGRHRRSRCRSASGSRRRPGNRTRCRGRCSSSSPSRCWYCRRPASPSAAPSTAAIAASCAAVSCERDVDAGGVQKAERGEGRARHRAVGQVDVGEADRAGRRIGARRTSGAGSTVRQTRRWWSRWSARHWCRRRRRRRP